MAMFRDLEAGQDKMELLSRDVQRLKGWRLRHEGKEHDSLNEDMRTFARRLSAIEKRLGMGNAKLDALDTGAIAAIAKAATDQFSQSADDTADETFD
jgi:hypothetical protein